MVAERARARRFPEHVVDHDPGARPIPQFGNRPAQVFAQHHLGNIAVRLPAVADLPGQAGVAFPLLPVDFVGGHAGFELATKQTFETGPQPVYRIVAHQAIDDQKTVLVELIDLFPGHCEHAALFLLEHRPYGRQSR